MIAGAEHAGGRQQHGEIAAHVVAGGETQLAHDFAASLD
jgi:hypothetical protein